MKATVTVLGCGLAGCNTSAPDRNTAVVKHLNPEGLHRNPAFSQVVTVDGPHRVVFVGGQNAVDSAGNIVGRGDIAAQSEQVCRNLETALEAAGARLEHVVKWTIYVVQGQSLQAGFAVFQREWGQRAVRGGPGAPRLPARDRGHRGRSRRGVNPRGSISAGS